MCATTGNCFDVMLKGAIAMTLTMNWAAVWMQLFGTTTLWGLDLGFWAALAAVALIVIAMNAVFWGMKPAAPRPEQKKTV